MEFRVVVVLLSLVGLKIRSKSMVKYVLRAVMSAVRQNDHVETYPQYIKSKTGVVLESS